MTGEPPSAVAPARSPLLPAALLALARAVYSAGKIRSER